MRSPEQARDHAGDRNLRTLSSVSQRLSSLSTRRRVLTVASMTIALGFVLSVALVARLYGQDGPEVVQLSADGDGIDTNRALEGTFIPAVSLRDLDGSTVDTGELDGAPLVVNFWYSSCPPCQQEMPAFAAVDRELGGRVRFIGINPVDTAAQASAFVDSVDVTYTNLLDPNGEMLAAAGISVFPTTLLIRADGTIVFQHAGPMTAAQLREAIGEHLPA